jgi:hypothetical protein
MCFMDSLLQGVGQVFWCGLEIYARESLCQRGIESLVLFSVCGRWRVARQLDV